jgi:hypothetical protein
MLRRELINIHSKEKQLVSFFEDDNVQVVREQAAASAHTHPDRMFLLVAIQLPKDYYTADPRHWEYLFNRLSYNGRKLEKVVFDEYQTKYRSPNTNIQFKAYDKAGWMSYPPELKPWFSTECTEYRIFGVPDKNSFVLPLEGDHSFLTRIYADQRPQPTNNILISSYYSVPEIVHFGYMIHEGGDSANSLYYYPYLRADTPNIISEESVRILDKNAKLLTGLLDLNIPKDIRHSGEHILHTKFYIEWVETDFGSAVRTRFEQIFYGMTVSKTVPYIGLFTSTTDVNRHKFFTESPKTKEPYLDMPTWKSWSNTNPNRNVPTLILYRGTSRDNYDRIFVTSTYMVVYTFRPKDSKETPDELKKSVMSWIQNFDALIPFVNEKDLHPDRWDLQTLTVFLTYPKKVDGLSTLRFNCVTPFYANPDNTKPVFTLLRTDRESSGVNSVEARLIQLSNEGPLNVSSVSAELSVTRERASELIRGIMARQEENGRLNDRIFRGLPSIIIGDQYAEIKLVKDQKLSTKYADILRYILSNPDSSELDALCPARLQTVAAESATIQTNVVEEDAIIDEAFLDLIDDFEQPQTKEEVQPEVPHEEKEPVLDVANKRKTTYSYFANKLKAFDPETFSGSSEFSRKCEKKLQPVVLTPSDKKRLVTFQEGKYDFVKNAKEGQLLDVDDPPGTFICPEYWCTKDEIPLREDQLIAEEGTLKCPVCFGKLETFTNSDPREYPLVKKEGMFPRFKYKSSTNGKDVPCCYTKSRTKKPGIPTELKDKYYVFLESKTNLPELRLAKVDADSLEHLYLKESYTKLVNNRLPTPYTKLDNQRLSENEENFFRVGLGHPSNTLPTLLGMTQKIPAPRDAIKTVLKCSFFRLWTKSSNTHFTDIYNKLGEFKDTTAREHIARTISGIDDAFEHKELSVIEELEYSALALQCDLFRFNVRTQTMGCFLYSPIVKPRTRGIIIMQTDQDIDILTHAKRVKNAITYRSNIFEPPFAPYTYRQSERLRARACSTQIPNYSQAQQVREKLFPDSAYSVILDPFGRGQAIYIPNKLVLPFYTTALPDTDESRIWGFSGLDLPTYDSMRTILDQAKETSAGYELEDGLYDLHGERSEILLVSGLRIPVKPEKVGTGEPREILETVKDETELAFGEPNNELKSVYTDISYDAEVYEFLLFQLSKDIQHDEFRPLRTALRSVPPKKKDVDPLLKKWFRDVTEFVDIKNPYDFISKIRTPCGQFKSKKECKGNLCGWDGKVCRIQVKKSVKEDRLFNRLLSTMIDNSKIRAVVLDGRSTPFFSTILYIDLPHEVILTDKEI